MRLSDEQGTTMASSSGHLVDDFESAFQNCIAAISNQEHISVTEQDEVKTSVEQSIQRFLDVAKELECFFLQKRFVLSINKPEQIVKADIAELKGELARKDSLIQRHQEKLQQWQAMLARAHGANTGSSPATGAPGQVVAGGVAATVPAPQGGPPPQVSSASQPIPPQPPNSQPPPSQVMPPPSQNAYQGPLAYLEQTTSNIGLPERR